MLHSPGHKTRVQEGKGRQTRGRDGGPGPCNGRGPRNRGRAGGQGRIWQSQRPRRASRVGVQGGAGRAGSLTVSSWTGADSVGSRTGVDSVGSEDSSAGRMDNFMLIVLLKRPISALESSPHLSPHTVTRFPEEQFHSFSTIGKEELYKLVKSAKPTTCMLDPIPSKLLTEVLPEVIDPLLAIINLSLSLGYVIKPLIKKTQLDLKDLVNYRPISNLPCL